MRLGGQLRERWVSEVLMAPKKSGAFIRLGDEPNKFEV